MRSKNSRRQFISTCVLGSLALAGCATLKPRNLGIIDTHTHFYDPRRPQGVPWPPKNDSLLHRPVLPEEWKPLAAQHGITGTVVVEASSWVEDNQWVLDLAAREPAIKGLVGHLKPGKPGFAEDLARFSANRLFRGIRVGLWDISLAPDNQEFVRDLRLVAGNGLALDVLGGPDMLSRISQLASAIPSLSIVVDHCAGARVDGKAPNAEWTAAIEQLARHDNIHMKVSGLVEGTGRAGAAPSDPEFYRPTIDVIWRAFGEDRVIFGSNWPVSARFAPFSTVFQIVDAYFQGKGPGAARKYFSTNAKRVYRHIT